MKYMGSKSFMLKNGLGHLIREKAREADRIVDLFAGASFISWFAAERLEKPVLAVDLQTYSKVFAEAIILRDEALDADVLEIQWLSEVEKKVKRSEYFKPAQAVDDGPLTKATVAAARLLCSEHPRVGVVWSAYGGHYFSPLQAIKIDVMRNCLPPENPGRSVCLAALLTAASKCVAAPGHTAQPFQPTRGAKKFLSEAWKRDPLELAKTILSDLAPRFAKIKGRAKVADAFDAAKTLTRRDLVFIDPPYSDVQYSRFYHVLETIASGECGPVTGSGRYPSVEKRPQSAFSKRSESMHALDKLLYRIATKQSHVILTFPAAKASNGISGHMIVKSAKRWYNISSKKRVFNHLSTLGGKKSNRSARKKKMELILSLRPRAAHLLVAPKLKRAVTPQK